MPCTFMGFTSLREESSSPDDDCGDNAVMTKQKKKFLKLSDPNVYITQNQTTPDIAFHLPGFISS